MKKEWNPVLAAGFVLAILTAAAVPFFFQALQRTRAERQAAEAARQAAEEKELRGELERLATKTGRLLAGPKEGGRKADDLAKIMGETQGLLVRLRQGSHSQDLLVGAGNLAARQRKEWVRLNRRVRRLAKEREAE
jgi:hypothetical protein